MSTKEVLTSFQDRQKKNLEDMAQQLVALQASIAQLCTEPSPSGSQPKQQIEKIRDPMTRIVQVDPSERTIELNQAAFHQRIK